jgi:hypothetical protein
MEAVLNGIFRGKIDDGLFESDLQGMSYYNHKFITIDGPEITSVTTSQRIFSAKEGL